MPAIFTLTTDFGLSETYVAEMKGVILKTLPDAVMVDVTHQIPAGDILAGSLALERAVAAFGPETIHLAVIDPGVGTRRRILVVEIAQQLVVCPDNGLINWAWKRRGPGRAHRLTWRPKNASNTFHGRDIIAPAGVLLASRTPLKSLAKRIDDPKLLEISPQPAPATSGWIIAIDHFGSVTTNIPAESLPKRAVDICTTRTNFGKIKNTYSDVRVGEPLALIGSSGLVEIAIRGGSAARTLGLRIGDAIDLH